MYIDFTICSEVHDLTFFKDMFPSSKVLQEGDILKSGKKIPYNEFSFIFKKDNYFYIDDLITSFKNFIGKNILSICEFIKLHKLKSSFCIVIKEETERPAISISHENLLFLCELNANIDFDFI